MNNEKNFFTRMFENQQDDDDDEGEEAYVVIEFRYVVTRPETDVRQQQQLVSLLASV